MRFYKAFTEKMATVVENKILDTTTYNYGLQIGQRTKEDANLFDTILNLSLQHDAPLDKLVSCSFPWNHNMAPMMLCFDLPREAIATLILKSRGCHVDISQSDPLKVSTRFLEHLYEHVRELNWLGCPKRTESLFACKARGDVETYLKIHSGNGVNAKHIYEIELLEGNHFDADMSLLDKIADGSSYGDVFPEINNYWGQNSTDAPIFESLLQGKVRILQRVN